MATLQFRTAHTNYGTRMFDNLQKLAAWKQVLGEVMVTGVAERVDGSQVTPVPETELNTVQVTPQLVEAARRDRAYSHKH